MLRMHADSPSRQVLLQQNCHVARPELGRGTIRFTNFYPEWAEPTYKIVLFMVITLTLIIIVPYLSGSQSHAFQRISIFV